MINVPIKARTDKTFTREEPDNLINTNWTDNNRSDHDRYLIELANKSVMFSEAPAIRINLLEPAASETDFKSIRTPNDKVALSISFSK